MEWLVVITVAILLLALAVLWLTQTTSKKSNFTALTSAVKDDVYKYLSVATNLTEYHPTIYKVTVEKEETETVHCTIEEDLGRIGKQTVPVSLLALPDVPSPSSPSVRFHFDGQSVKVTVKLIISDNDDDNTPEKTKIDVSVTFDGMRVIVLLFSNNITLVWTKCVSKLKTILER